MAIDESALRDTAEDLIITLTKYVKQGNSIEKGSVRGVSLVAATIATLKRDTRSLDSEYDTKRDAFEAANTP